LCEFGDSVLTVDNDVSFNFSKCQFLRPNAIAFLGGLTRLIESKGRRVTFDFNTAPDKVMTILRQNDFAHKFGYPHFSGPGRSVPYREDRLELIRPSDLKDDIIDYLYSDWLGRGWVHISQRLKNAIVGVVWEIYDNAFEHAHSSIGIYSCGQYFPRLRILQLAVADFGIGIPENVRHYLHLRDEQLPAEICLRWAFQEGASTKTQGTRRGLGLNLLKDFVNLNHGTLEIYSKDGYAIIRDGKERFRNRKNSLQGTIVNMTFRCDESYYLFDDEIPTGPLF
jgi:signal transduction histidine kinase